MSKIDVSNRIAILSNFAASLPIHSWKVSSSSRPYTLDEGLARTLEFEFVHPRTDDIQFVSE